MNTRRINRDIVECYYSVLCFEDVAEKFGLGWFRILSIVAGDKAAGQSDARGAKVLLEMRASNDLGRKWPVVNIIDSLQVNTRTRSALFTYYHDRQLRETSLQDFMDLVVLRNPIRNHLFGCTGLTNIRNLGRESYWLVLHRLSTLDYGENAGMEWKRKLAMLRGFGRSRDLPPSFVWDGQPTSGAG